MDAAILARVSFLADLEPETLTLLAKHAVRYELVADQVAFQEGAPADGLFIVASGWLKGSRIVASGREQVLRYVGPGEAINEISLFVEVAYPATVIAMEPSVVWLIPRLSMRKLVEEHPQLWWPLTQHLATRLLYVVGLLEDLALLPLEARLAKFLLDHATDGAFERQPWATQAELASRLGTVPDVLHRVLRSLSEQGLIAIERHRIAILDQPGLEARAVPG